jgi:hypothetical protein
MLAMDSLLLAQHIDAAITMLERSYTTARLTALTFLLPLQALLRLLYCFFFFLNNSHCIRIAKCGES